MESITGKNLVGNNWSAEGTTTFATFDPQLNQENEWQFTEASRNELIAAVRLAEQAFHEFQRVSGKDKAAFLRSIADHIEALGEELIRTYCKETGLPANRAIGERGRTCFQLRTFADLVEEGSWVNATIDTADPGRKPLPKPDLRKMNIPIGPIAVFGASNFPLAYSTAGGDTASALAAGCPVVVKGHPMHAGTGELVARAVLQAAEENNMPVGVFSNLNSKGIEVGQALVQHPGIKGVGFTGSVSGGRALFDLASQRPEPIPVFAEMGSVNPVVLLPGALEANSEKWAKAYAASITLGTGQFCTKPGLLFAMESDAIQHFTLLLSEAIAEIPAACMVHPQIWDRYDANASVMTAQEGIEELVAIEGNLPPNYARHEMVKVKGKDFLSNPKLHQEVFGPFSMLVACNDEQQLLEAIAALEGQLTGTVIGENEELDQYTELVNKLSDKVGRIIFNGVPTGVEVCPSMQHGGPYPASTDSRFGAVGIHAIQRWVRPLSFQNWPDNALPDALKSTNPLGISRLVNGKLTSDVL